MAVKRTRKDKVLAQLRRKVESQNAREREERSERPEFKPDFYQPEISLPLPAMTADLTRTAIVTILALALQMATVTYLNKGGWNVVLTTLQRIVERR